MFVENLQAIVRVCYHTSSVKTLLYKIHIGINSTNNTHIRYLYVYLKEKQKNTLAQKKIPCDNNRALTFVSSIGNFLDTIGFVKPIARIEKASRYRQC